jgi:CspA family cold shock protein
LSTHRGTVASFDAHRGLGVIVDGTGDEWPFHCVEIADGSRSIEVGTPVCFSELLKLGRREAAGIVPQR